MTDDQFLRQLENLELRDSERAKCGLPPLDRDKVNPKCTAEPLCSPYMSQPWGHDSRCPAGGPKGIRPLSDEQKSDNMLDEFLDEMLSSEIIAMLNYFCAHGMRVSRANVKSYFDKIRNK